jgi:hypothetical protein
MEVSLFLSEESVWLIYGWHLSEIQCEQHFQKKQWMC